MARRRGLGGYYHRRLAAIHRHLVAPGLRVLELGCGQGDLLAALKPSVGVGIDFSSHMVEQARLRHPELRFIQADAHDPPLDETFDVVILSDLVNDLWDVQRVFEQVHRLSTPRTRVIVNFYSRVWELPLGLAEALGLAHPSLSQNWLTAHDVRNLLNLAGFEMLRHWSEVLWPVPTPLIDGFCNRFLVRFWPFRWLALTNFVVARPVGVEEHGAMGVSGHGGGAQPSPVRIESAIPNQQAAIENRQSPTVSVVVPARNEEGNIDAIFDRVPEMGGGTELVFVEGHSTDNTYQAIQRAMAANPHRKASLHRQKGKGKGDAVRLGFDRAEGDILMILDADLTVAPEDLPRFYEALRSGKGEFVNGVRLVYPMEKRAMRLANLAGNKLFSHAFSWLLGQTLKDTLCGTKAMWRADYEHLAANRPYFGDFDPFGDFDLLLGAAKLNLKIIDMPVRYGQRTYGTTNIRRWKHGWMLLKMLLFAARRLKFV
jgi:SAM-dependent methyltransferase